MQQPTGVAVLATRLADTDRRALSQAWYSALHLAAGAERTLPSRRACAALAPSRRANAPGAATAPLAAAQASLRAPHAGVVPRVPGPAATERRAPHTALSRRIERGLVRRTPRGGAASFAVRDARGRIHLIVRADGARAHVVAVCAPALRERVERALAQARFALAARGVRVGIA